MPIEKASPFFDDTAQIFVFSCRLCNLMVFAAFRTKNLECDCTYKSRKIMYYIFKNYFVIKSFFRKVIDMSLTFVIDRQQRNNETNLRSHYLKDKIITKHNR